MSDLLAVQQDISREISERLRQKLSGEEQQKLVRLPTENTEAYQAYLKGRYYWNKRSEEGFKKAVEYFQQATDKDPNYALAYAGLADTYRTASGLQLGSREGKLSQGQGRGPAGRGDR